MRKITLEELENNPDWFPSLTLEYLRTHRYVLVVPAPKNRNKMWHAFTPYFLRGGCKPMHASWAPQNYREPTFYLMMNEVEHERYVDDFVVVSPEPTQLSLF